MDEEPVSKLHAFEKSMILKAPCQDQQAGPDRRDENILEQVGESRQWQGDPKGRFCVAESFETGSELIKDTLTYIRQNYKATDTVLASKEDVLFFHQEPAPIPAMKLQETSAPAPRVTLRPAPQPPKVSEPEVVQAPKVAPPEPPPRMTASVDTMEEMRKLVTKAAPHVKLKTEVPDDARAKKIANLWQEELQTIEVALFSFGETGPHLTFLNNVAKAITNLIAPAKVIDAERFEQEKKWDVFFAAHTLKLALAPDVRGWKTTELATYYKANPTTSSSQLGTAPLLILQPISTYLKTPKEKRLLWNSLVSHLSS